MQMHTPITKPSASLIHSSSRASRTPLPSSSPSNPSAIPTPLSILRDRTASILNASSAASLRTPKPSDAAVSKQRRKEWSMPRQPRALLPMPSSLDSPTVDDVVDGCDDAENLPQRSAVTPATSKRPHTASSPSNASVAPSHPLPRTHVTPAPTSPLPSPSRGAASSVDVAALPPSSLLTLQCSLLRWEDKLSTWKAGEEERIAARFARLLEQKRQWEEWVREQSRVMEARERRGREREREVEQWLEAKREDMRREAERREDERRDEARRRDDAVKRSRTALEADLRQREDALGARTAALEEREREAERRRQQGDGLSAQLRDIDDGKRMIIDDLHARAANAESAAHRLLAEKAASDAHQRAVQAELDALREEVRALRTQLLAAQRGQDDERRVADGDLAARAAAVEGDEASLRAREAALTAERRRLEDERARFAVEMAEVREQSRQMAVFHLSQGVPAQSPGGRPMVSPSPSCLPASSASSVSPLTLRLQELQRRELSVQEKDEQLYLALSEAQAELEARERQLRQEGDGVDGLRERVRRWEAEVRGWEERLERREEEVSRKERHLQDYLGVFDGDAQQQHHTADMPLERGLLDELNEGPMGGDGREGGDGDGLLDLDTLGEGSGGGVDDV